ncbi:MAG: STAS/SEC14 domain-containing protein [Kaistella sp.]|nr:STAS/SEC14 domain-containing protein [Kaistella sp.]
MISKINDLPGNMIGFRATGDVTAEDFQNTVIPEVKEFLKTQDQLNYMLVLDTDVKNFTSGAWISDAWLGLKELTKWNRSAIISDSKTIKVVTDIFSKVMIGEFKVFEHSDYDAAVAWVSDQN